MLLNDDCKLVLPSWLIVAGVIVMNVFRSPHFTRWRPKWD